MTTIYLVRHGETRWNKERKFQGHTDIPLSEKGLLQAQLVSEKLADVDFAAIYSSDLERARTTAQKLAEKKQIPVKSCSSLREIDFGQWEGKDYARIMEEYPEEAQSWFRDPASVTVPGGESSGDICRRLQCVLDRIVNDHPHEKVAVFSHGGPIRYLVMLALKMPEAMFWRLEIGNASISILKSKKQGYYLNCLNNDSHLEVLEGADTFIYKNSSREYQKKAT